MITLQTAAGLAELQREKNRVVGLVTGCFDILHPGHIRHLADARGVVDYLVVAINDDASVSRLKGPERPVFSAEERALVLESLRTVDIVTVFPGDHAGEAIRAIRPKIWIKGDDYSLDSIQSDEKTALEEVGAFPLFIARVPGFSTTGILESLRGS